MGLFNNCLPNNPTPEPPPTHTPACDPPDHGACPTDTGHSGFGNFINALNDSFKGISVLSGNDVNVGDVLSHNSVAPVTNVDLSQLVSATDTGQLDGSFDSLVHSVDLFDTTVVDIGEFLGNSHGHG